MITVTMKDKFFSGWGQAEGRVNIFMVHCDTFAQAEAIATAANDREEMRNIKIHNADKKPYYTPSRYLVSEKNFSELGPIWTGECTS
jgi:hypothetical protein